MALDFSNEDLDAGFMDLDDEFSQFNGDIGQYIEDALGRDVSEGLLLSWLVMHKQMSLQRMPMVIKEKFSMSCRLQVGHRAIERRRSGSLTMEMSTP